MTEQRRSETSRRRFIGYLVAAPTLAASVTWMSAGDSAEAVLPTLPQPENLFDLGDLQNLAALPTSGLITVQVNEDGTASFALHRCEVGQGITTTVAMMIAEELDLPVGKITVTLADARPELLMNQLTGGSNSVRSIFTPVRTAAAIARERLVRTAAARWGVPEGEVTTEDGVVRHADRSLSYGDLAKAAATDRTIQVSAELKNPAGFRVLGRSHNRIDALEAVTGRKTFGMDMAVPDALPCMVRRPPTINGTVRAVRNMAEVEAMPGITDVAVITYGVAVRGETFGQCIDGIALALTSSLHIKDGIPLEGSWSNYFYTRQWNTPPSVEVVVMPPTTGKPSGIGELGVAPSFAAVACAYARATGTVPTSFPINHGTLGFEPFPLQPSTPQSPTDGLDHTF